MVKIQDVWGWKWSSRRHSPGSLHPSSLRLLTATFLNCLLWAPLPCVCWACTYQWIVDQLLLVFSFMVVLAEENYSSRMWRAFCKVRIWWGGLTWGTGQIKTNGFWELNLLSPCGSLGMVVCFHYVSYKRSTDINSGNKTNSRFLCATVWKFLRTHRIIDENLCAPNSFAKANKICDCKCSLPDWPRGLAENEFVPWHILYGIA